MREIKFRAWSINGKRMVWWDEMSKNPHGLLRYLTWNDMYVLMQFTGLHDKNGREIYEGDIVTREHVKLLSAAVLSALGRPQEQPKTQNEAVVWLQGEAGFYGECCGSHTTPNYKSLINAHVALEVIGNIYEKEAE